MEEMLQYLGVKIIFAEPQEAQKDSGDSKRGDPGYKVVYDNGYESWSPQDVFEAAYRRIEALTFGLAIEALKLGKKVARTGWNGKDMWLTLIRGTNTDDGKNTTSGDYSVNRNAIKPSNIEGGLGLLPWIGMKTVQGDFVPWLASQTDVLAEDWMIVE